MEGRLIARIMLQPVFIAASTDAIHFSKGNSREIIHVELEEKDVD